MLSHSLARLRPKREVPVELWGTSTTGGSGRLAGYWLRSVTEAKLSARPVAVNGNAGRCIALCRRMDRLNDILSTAPLAKYALVIQAWKSFFASGSDLHGYAVRDRGPGLRGRG